MKSILSLVFLSTVCTGILKSQTIDYSALAIPDTLKRASVVKRFEQFEFEISDVDRASLKVHQVLAVMGEEGKGALTFAEHLDKFTSLEDAEIKVYDAVGRQVSKYKKKDFATVAIGSGLIDDSKTTYFTVTAASYPIVVEYQYELKFKGTLFYPRYQILKSGEGIEYSSYIARISKDMELRYKEKSINIKPDISSDGKYNVYQWTVKNMPPVEYEEGSVSFESRYPAVLMAPTHFKYGGYEGDMSSWKSFGLWYGSLKKGLDVLSEDQQVFFQNLVRNAKTEKEKISIIYNYLQRNFRYVSIQLGIGGFQPFPATVTNQKKYGDCKALSNFMEAALSAVGIRSYQALINAEFNKEPVDPNFPCNQFNHVIVCVPQQKDSIWLECTSNTTDFGVLGNFTENRNALLITENGGVLVRTPSSKCTDNEFVANTIINLQEDGSAKSSTDIATTGEYKQDFVHYLFDEKTDDQKWLIVNYLGFKHPDQFTVRKNDTSGNLITSINLELEKLPEFVAGTKMFLSPRIYKLWSSKLPKSENRRLDYYFECPFVKTDTTAFILPTGYMPDALPAEKHLSNEYCSYSTKFWYDESKKALMSAANLTLLNYKIPADKYAMVKKFFDDVMVDNNQRIVIKKQ